MTQRNSLKTNSLSLLDKDKSTKVIFIDEDIKKEREEKILAAIKFGIYTTIFRIITKKTRDYKIKLFESVRQFYFHGEKVTMEPQPLQLILNEGHASQ